MEFSFSSNVVTVLYYDNGPNEERVEKEGGKKKELITVEVKNGSASRATARGYGDLL
jgi:hypothetical protein